MVEYEAVIGLEVHAQLSIRTKLFCGCSTPFGDPPNTHGCPVCLGFPGALPVLNREAVVMAVRAGLALGCTIEHKSIFARKNYFYPDLPKGYQISQYDMPLCIGGALSVSVNGHERRIGITRIHLEEDAGKLVHDQDAADSLFDVNRCGTPLIEIVSEPDLRSGAEAYAYLTALKQILEYLNVCDCNMEEGSLRCDANISVRPKGHTKLGTKIEIKNMNSFRSLEKALAYETERQIDTVRSGGVITQQTFLWDPATGQSVPMRSKEDAHDYRYFPDPDLVPLLVDRVMIAGVKAALPELPAARRGRLERSYALAPDAADVLTSSRAIADYYEAVLAAGAEARTAANWVMGEILRMVKEIKTGPGELRVTPERLAVLLAKVKDNTLSAQAAKKVLEAVQAEDRDPAAIIAELGLAQISDTGALEAAVRKVIEANPGEVERYRKGEKKLTGFFVGQAMKATAGKGNPREIGTIVARLLS
ncbi:MAG: Asp-tRNA(Asn)/Glu-tRNA(Gln) amidotransferase subunit GatB [Chitinispirillaceae bacterium]|nr:Asp-tRNA(Asn)/Glu-tRNA(Gln) amidotransferase subunit GatB [Chitinispirillaceae bacterium]